MAQDLSRAEPRTANQRRDRLTDNRTSILPERRDTRADRLQQFSTMSSARRGDGGAEALMRTLGLVKEAAGDFQQYANTKFQKDEADNAARGSLDQAADKVDEEKAERSNAYRNAVARGRTMAAWNDGLRTFGDELSGAVERQDQLTLEERQDEIRQRVEDFFEGFAVDPETGKLRSFLATPDSMKYLAEQMGAARPQFETLMLQRIEEKFNEETLTLYSVNVGDQLKAGKQLDLALASAVLPPTVTDEQRRKALIDTVMAVSDELKQQGRPEDGRRAYLQLLGTAPAVTDGTLAALPDGPQPVPVPPSSAAKPAPRADRVSFDKLAAAVMHRESRGNPDAVSPKGARGTMQTMPGTLTDPGYGVRPAANDTPAELGRVGKDYLRAMLREYRGNYAHALAAYNAGPGNADKWVAEFGALPTDEFIARIPFRETREYVKAILGSLGVSGGSQGGAVTPDDPVIADPTFRLPEEPLDPIDVADRDFAAAALPPLLTGGMMLTPAERVKLTEASDQYAREVRSEWEREKAKGENQNADAMTLRLFGLGPRITSEDINAAARSGAIRADHAASLLNGLQQNAVMAERYRDRQEAAADRARSKEQEDAAERLIAHYTGDIYTGRETPAQARARLLQDVGRISDPAVRAAVMSAVGEEANRIETLRANSAPFRRTMTRVDEAEPVVLKDVRSSQVQTLLRNKVDVARKRIAERIADGDDPDTAYNEEMRKVAAEKVRLAPSRQPAPASR